jgi:hypothetical protein
VVSQDGDFEVRDYPTLTVAETTIQADRNSAGYRGFRVLAGSIFGGNAAKQHIAECETRRARLIAESLVREITGRRNMV